MAWSRNLSICLVQAVRPRLPIRTVTAAPAGRIFLGRRPMSGHSLDQARVADLDGIIWPAPARTSNRWAPAPLGDPNRHIQRRHLHQEARRLNRLAARCQASAADSAPGGARARVAGPSRRQGRQHPGPAGAVLGEAVEQHDPAHRLAGQRRGRQDQPMGGEPERFHPGAWVAVAVSQGAASPGPHRQYTARAQQGWSLLTNRPRPECRKQPPSCDLRFTRFPEPGARPDDPPRGRPRCDSTTSIRSQSDARGAGARQPRCELTQHGGNLSGNPGVTIRHHRTGLDGIGPVPEQPGWLWVGPA